MNLKDYLAISGEHGLFKFIAQGRNAIIVEHLETGKRSSAHGSAKVSSLEDISVFTQAEDIPLSKVFDSIFEKENGGPALDPKEDNEKLKAYFASVLPEFDRDRVYVSDIRKMLTWYNTLQKLNLLVKEEPEAEKKEGEEKAEETSSVSKTKLQKEEKPKEKKARKVVRPAGKTESKSAAVKSKGAPKAK
ncbi:MAG TPA: DUF5606 domain-containing protein [Bacteroidales bacterium]|nr:DUF5606 domain-containing protein [Bacteroidales bacterium]